MQPTIGRYSTQPGLGFTALFIISATIVAGLIGQQPKAVMDFCCTLTITITKALGSLLGLAMTRDADILTVNGFAMRIVGDCTALNYIAILALAILLYTRHSFAYRLAGVAVATLAVLLTNVVRLIVTGLTGSISPESFRFVHEYLFVAVFALLVFAIWKIWADGRIILSKKTVVLAAFVAVSCTGVFLLLIAFKDSYCRLLATLATPLFKLLIGDPQATLIWDGKLHFTQGITNIRMGLFFEMANIAVYVSLMLPYLWRNRKEIPFALLGLAVQVILYAEFIAIMGLKAINDGIASAEIFLIIGSSVFLALPMALYWMVTSMQWSKNEIRQG